MTVRVLIAGAVLSTLAACVPGASIDCPTHTDELFGACVVSCAADEECLVDEICDGQKRACLPGEGEQPVVIELRASHANVTRGRPVQIFYRVEGATRVEIDHQTLASTPELRGEVWTQPILEPTTLELIAFGPGGRTHHTIDIAVNDNPAPPTIVAFTMTPEQPRANELVTIAWNVAGAERVRIVNGAQEIHATNQAQGTIAYFPTGPATLVLQAINEAGENSAQLTLDVDAPATIDDFEPSSEAAAVGQEVELSWRTSGAVVLQILSEGNMPIFRSEDPTVVADGTHAVMIPMPMPQQSSVKFTLVVTGGEGDKTSRDIVINVLSSGN